MCISLSSRPPPPAPPPPPPFYIFSLTGTPVVGSRYSLGFQGGGGGARSSGPDPCPSPQPPRGSGPSDSDTPIGDRDTYPSRTRILEGVCARSSRGVSKTKGPDPRGGWRVAGGGTPGAHPGHSFGFKCEVGKHQFLLGFWTPRCFPP